MGGCVGEGICDGYETSIRTHTHFKWLGIAGNVRINFIQSLFAKQSLYNAWKWKKITENIDSILDLYLKEYAEDNLTSMEPTIKYGEYVKINHFIK